MIDRITEQSFCQTRVSGSISITKGRTERYRAVYSNSNWFDECEWYSIKDDGECLKIQKCLGIEIPKNAQKFPKTKHFQFTSELPIGKFEFDEDESDKDTLVIYYR
jgi:hypothetical protein